MKFDESNSAITNSFCGKTVDHVIRNGKTLEFVTTCGHKIKLLADVNGDIHFGGQSVSIMLTPQMMGTEQGVF